MKKLSHVQTKLLRKVDLFNFQNEKLPRENACIARFRLKNNEEYRKYRALSGKVFYLVSKLKELAFDSPVKAKLTRELLNFLYHLGVVDNAGSLDVCENVDVAAFCKRRLPHVLLKLGMAKHMNHAGQLIEHGHVRVGLDVVTDPARLITRDMEDLVTWTQGSKYKRAISEFKDEEDDYDLLA